MRSGLSMKIGLFIVTALAPVIFAHSAAAATFNWVGGDANNWVDNTAPSPWSPVPANFSTVADVFNISNSPTALTLTTSTFSAQLNINSSGTLNVSQGITANNLHLAGGTLANTTGNATLTGTSLFADASTSSTVSLTVGSAASFRLLGQLNDTGTIHTTVSTTDITREIVLDNDSTGTTTFSGGTIEHDAGFLHLQGSVATNSSPFSGGTINVNSGAYYRTGSGFGNGTINIKSGGFATPAGNGNTRVASNLHLQGGTLIENSVTNSGGTTGRVGEGTELSKIFVDSSSTISNNNTSSAVLLLLQGQLNAGATPTLNINNASAAHTVQFNYSGVAHNNFAPGTINVNAGLLELTGFTTTGNKNYDLGGGTAHVNSGGLIQLNQGFGNGTVVVQTGGIAQVTQISNNRVASNLHLNGGSLRGVSVNGAQIGSTTTGSNLFVDGGSTLGSTLNSLQVFNVQTTLLGSQTLTVNTANNGAVVNLQPVNTSQATYVGDWDILKGNLTVSGSGLLGGAGDSRYALGSGRTINVASGHTLSFGNTGANSWEVRHTITGNGTIAGATGDTLSFTSGGLDPASAATSLTVSNFAGLAMSNGATLTANLNGNTPNTQHDQLTVNGTVNLSGANLYATLGGGYTPAGGDILVILNKTTAGAITGTFNGYAQGSTVNLGNYTAVVSYTGGSGSNDVTLSGFAPVGTPNLYHWKGGADSAWNNSSNWTVDATGTSPTNATPTPTSDVLFSIGPASGNAPALNVGTTLGQDFTMRGLTFIGNTSAGNTVGVAAGNTITVGIGGLHLQQGSAAPTISADVDLSTAQTWSNSSTVNPLTVAGTLDNGGNLLTISGVGNVEFSGTVTGAGGLTNAGRGMITLSGANNYAGTTTISGGVVNVRNGSGLGATTGGTTVAAGAALQLQGNINIGAEALTLNSDGISNTGSLRNISGNNSYGGLITLTSFSRINSDSGTLTLDVASGNAIASTAQPLRIDGPGNVIVRDPIALGSGALTKDGAGTLTLSAANTYTGSTNMFAGALTLDFSAAGAPINNIINASSGLTLGGTLNIQGNASTNNSQTLNGLSVSVGPGVINAAAGSGGTLNLSLGTITRSVGSSLSLALPANVNIMTSNSNLNSILGSGLSVGSGASTRYATVSGSVIGPYSGAATVTDPNSFVASTNFEFAPVSSTTTLSASRTAYTVRYTGAGNTIDLGAAGANNLALTGLMAAGSGTLVIERTGGSGTLAMPSSSDLAVNTASSDIVISAPVSGSNSSITKFGPSTLTLNSTANTYTGRTHILGGTLVIAAEGSLGINSNPDSISLNGGALGVAAAGSVTIDDNNRGITIGAQGGGFDVGAGGTLTVSNTISGTGSVTKSNSGTLVFNNVNAANTYTSGNNYTGNTIISGGTLMLAAVDLIPDGAGRGNVVFNPSSGSATLDLAGFNDVINGLSSSGAGSSIVDNSVGGGPFTLTLGNNDASGSFGGIVRNTAGTLAVTKIGTGTQTFSGANSYSGVTNVNVGILNVQHATGLGGATGGTNVNQGATLQIQASIGNEALTLSGAGAGGQNGSLVNVSGANTYAGLITLASDVTIASDAGSLALTNAGTITGSGFGLVLTGSGNGNIVSNIGTGAAPLTKNGDGVWTLSGANSYSGETNVTAGTLVLNGTHLLAGAPTVDTYTVFNGATLAGSGVTDGEVFLRGGSTISPGNSPGILSTGGETWSAGANYLFEINDATGIAGNTVAGWDLLEISGALDLGDLSAGDEFTILLTSLTPPLDTAGAPGADNFSAASNYAWLIARSDEEIDTYLGTSQFIVDTSDFANAVNGVFTVVRGDSVSGGDNMELYLVYTSDDIAAVPEPGAAALAAIGLLGLGFVICWRRESLLRNTVS